MRPVMPSRTTHDVPEPTSQVTQGTPLASASASTVPNASARQLQGSTKRSASR